jgi:hypothetical protein
MELQEAIAAYRERIKHVLSQMDPAPTDERLRETTDRLMSPIENGGGDGNGSSRSLAPGEPST